MRLVYGVDAGFCQWASLGLFGIPDAFDDKCRAIGVVDDDKILAAVVYSNYIPNVSIEMSVYSVDKAWCTRHNLRQLFMYVFAQMNLERVQATCSAQSEDVIAFLKRLGFQQEGYHRKAHFNGGDSLSFGMLKHECRWIR